MNSNDEKMLEEYHSILNQIPMSVKHQLGFVSEAMELINKSMPSIDQDESVIRAMNSIRLEYQRSVELIQSSPGYTELMSYFDLNGDDYDKAMKTLLCPAFESLQRLYDSVPKGLRKSIILLANKGWFWDLNMTLESLSDIVQAIEEGEEREVNIVLCDFFRRESDGILSRMITAFPSRREII